MARDHVLIELAIAKISDYKVKEPGSFSLGSKIRGCCQSQTLGYHMS